MSDLALKTSRGLEKARRKVLGPTATITLLDRNGQTLMTCQDSFFVERKNNVALGASWLEAEIAEKSSVTGNVQATQAQMLKVVTVRYGGMQFNAAQDDDPVTAERTWKLRLTPFKRNQA